MKGHFVPIVKMPDASFQMPEASPSCKLQMASGKLRGFADCKASRGSKKLKLCDSLSLFFTVGKKEGGPTFNKLKIKG